jgi:hypothetical protein
MGKRDATLDKPRITLAFHYQGREFTLPWTIQIQETRQ